MPWADQLNTTCCLFSRLPRDPRVTRPLPGDLSDSTSLAVHLYRVANSSVARLHRNISTCPGTQADCEMGKLDSEKSLRTAVNYPGTWISFGPVLRGKVVDSDAESRGPDKTSQPREALGLGWGCVLLLAAFTLLYLGCRRGQGGRPWIKSSGSADQSQPEHWV
ncbi:uncharacterized protein LOC125712226 [Brienomyrus brachyistius]|uniref:uncharacterized protein LOC125712226 n=1 Tax=Brienomyrus brachyistius TaxID=42636 RepID=UPI0020B20F07|nr:uncharacterized protein LOC125712226 [Brienomyrus brachyistius]